MTKGYMQIVDGDWFEPTHGKQILQCCDCALVHVYEFVVINRGTREVVSGVQVQFKVKRDNRRTSASRRKLKFTKDDHD